LQSQISLQKLLTLLPSKLHLKAAVLVPPYNKQKPSTIMIGVMKLEKVPMDELSPDDFLWIKCHGVSYLEVAYQPSPETRWLPSDLLVMPV